MDAEFLRRNSIGVLVEQPFYYVGDPVKGALYINVVKPFDCDVLELSVRRNNNPLSLDAHTLTYVADFGRRVHALDHHQAGRQRPHVH